MLYFPSSAVGEFMSGASVGLSLLLLLFVCLFRGVTCRFYMPMFNIFCDVGNFMLII